MSRPAARTAGNTLAEVHQKRARRLLLIGSAVTAAGSVGWGICFALKGYWLPVALDVVTILLSAAAAALAATGRMRAASRLLIAVLFTVLCFQAGVLDIPTAEVPRSMHQYLLALGVVSILLTQDEPAWLRHGIPLLCLAAYAGFASTNAGWPTPLALPDSIRASGTWINLVVAISVVFVTLQVIQADMLGRSDVERHLRTSLAHGEFFLHYQPQMDADGRVIGAEALLRWKHPKRGLVSPAEFIPVAEQSGLMVPLGEWVLKTACRQLALWRQQPDTRHLVLAVNVSASQFTRPDFVSGVLRIVSEAGADPGRLKIELTESMLANDLEDIIEKMTALKQHGIAFSLDDFGTGFSSLTYLRRLPLDQLKIDQSFVRDVLTSSNGAGIAQAVVTLGQTLGLEVIAEGVETLAQREFLSSIGCQLFQGYLFSKPVAIAEFDAFVAAQAGLNRPQAAEKRLRTAR
jgi:EAL domain-containing protein (putative c-di-GMP-specific phosphodiesterase class I)